MYRLLFALLLCLPLWPAQAAEPQPPVLRVGLAEVPPFVMRDEEGAWGGISVELWEQVAELADLRYEYRPVAFEDLLAGVEAGQLDVAIGALTMTAERERSVDFSHAFYHTGLAIAVPRDASGWGALRTLFSWRFFSLVLGLGGLLMLVGVALWLFERKHNREQFGDSAVAGVGNGFWLAAVTMTTVGYGDKAPVTLGGRLVALVWMFSALIMVSTFTAAITSVLTVGSLRSGIQGPEDLVGAQVATVPKTASASYLHARRLSAQTYPDLLSAMRAVQDGKADALVYDKPLLQYRNAELPDGGLSILPGTFENQSYAFALTSDSPYREIIGRQVLRVTGSPHWQAVLQSYLGEP